eukprot:TRINITY_DN15023_c0_g1_i1.p1 TRINITY_DN15023_c0_g1~~TRINITY_DN15023_c0_g1_i1.p1  ORF type:complete len:132 (-),score=27.65 TRINITY_DN15023_c0_g1_i1:271-645(-)
MYEEDLEICAIMGENQEGIDQIRKLLELLPKPSEDQPIRAKNPVPTGYKRSVSWSEESEVSEFRNFKRPRFSSNPPEGLVHRLPTRKLISPRKKINSPRPDQTKRHHHLVSPRSAFSLRTTNVT